MIANRLFVLWITSLVLTLGGCASKPQTVDVRPQTTLHTPAPADAIPSARKAVVQTAQNMIGRPYRYGGSGPRAFDCSGLVYFSFSRAGIDVPRTAHQQFNSSRQIHSRKLQPGDLVFFDVGGRKISHVGIYVGAGDFVHAPSSGKRVSVESLDNPYWRDRIIGAGDFF